MTKKRAFALIAAAMLLAGALCGCGASAGGTDAAAAEEMSVEAEGYTLDSVSTSSAAARYAGAEETQSAGTQDAEAKIIYTAQLDMETTEFDGAVAALAALTEECGGYYESSQVSDWGSGYRYASFSVRVPAENYRDFLSRAGELCHVLSTYEYADDISEVYYDTAGRLETQQTKLARLQELLAQAESMEDIITIESAISETEEEIESLSGTLRRYDSQVSYSTVTISLDEVYKLSNVEEPAVGFWAKLGAAFASGCRGFADSVESLLLALAYGWVWVLLLAAAVTVTVILCRKRKRSRKAGENGDGGKP